MPPRSATTGDVAAQRANFNIKIFLRFSMLFLGLSKYRRRRFDVEISKTVENSTLFR